MINYDISVPQTLPARSDMVKNDAGGYGFVVSDMAMLERFLMTGAACGTYYVSVAANYVRANEALLRILASHPHWYIETVARVSDEGLAPKNDHAIYALALAAASDVADTRKNALLTLPKVCRTSYHLFTFLKYSRTLRGWGRMLKKAVQEWYLSKSVDQLAYQLVKYRQREGWTHADVLRLAKPVPTDESISALFAWTTGRIAGTDLLPPMITDYIFMESGQSKKLVLECIERGTAMRETIPTDFLNDPDVLAALAPKMPTGALLRNLRNLDKAGVFNDREVLSVVMWHLENAERISKARIHPIGVLLAIGACHTAKVKPAIMKSLNDAFYAAFKSLPEIDKRIMIGLDVSSSMTWRGDLGISSAEIGGALCMAFLKTAAQCDVYGFSSKLVELPFHANMSLEEVLDVTRGMTFGSTDCSLPIAKALADGTVYDAFVMITDYETWCGGEHVHVVLERYRKKVNPNAKLIGLSTTSNTATICDPNDPGSMDIAGFSADVPAVMNSFING